MYLIKDIIAGNEYKLLGVLARTGLSPAQAEAFLSAAGESVAGAVSRGGGNQDRDRIMGAIDAGALASTTGLDASLVEKGLNALLPLLVDKFSGATAGSLLSRGNRPF